MLNIDPDDVMQQKLKERLSRLNLMLRVRGRQVIEKDSLPYRKRIHAMADQIIGGSRPEIELIVTKENVELYAEAVNYQFRQTYSDLRALTMHQYLVESMRRVSSHIS